LLRLWEYVFHSNVQLKLVYSFLIKGEKSTQESPLQHYTQPTVIKNLFASGQAMLYVHNHHVWKTT